MPGTLEEDYRKMSQEIHDFVDDMDGALNHDCGFGRLDYRNVIVCGMGASAIGGDVMTQSVGNISKYPIKVNKFPDIPSWVDDRTLAIVSSYSGNTKETLMMYDSVLSRGCSTIVLTTGGKLGDRAASDGTPRVIMPSGTQPRSSLGRALGHLACILDETGGTECRQEYMNALPHLRRLRDRLEDTDLARGIAEAIGDKVPVIYSTNTLYSSALRWKTQINENSKSMAFSGSVPDFNHNEVCGWARGDMRSSLYPIFLFEENANIEVRKAMRASIDTLRSYGVDCKVVKISGRTITERLLSSVMIGDYTSLYLSEVNGVDPVGVESINEFKQDLSRRLSDPDARQRRRSIPSLFQ